MGQVIEYARELEDAHSKLELAGRDIFNGRIDICDARRRRKEAIRSIKSIHQLILKHSRVPLMKRLVAYLAA